MALLRLRMTPQSQGYSPYKIVYGRPPSIIKEVSTNLPQVTGDEISQQMEQPGKVINQVTKFVQDRVPFPLGGEIHDFVPRDQVWSRTETWLLGPTLEGSISVQFSRSVVSNSLRPHESQHANPTCPSPTPGLYPNACPSSRWCHPTISSSVIIFSSCPQSLPSSGSFPISQLFAWGGQTIGASASASVRPMNTQDWSPLGWSGWISLSPRDSQESSPTPQFKSINFSALSFLHSPTLTSIWPLEKP